MERRAILLGVWYQEEEFAKLAMNATSAVGIPGPGGFLEREAIAFRSTTQSYDKISASTQRGEFKAS